MELKIDKLTKYYGENLALDQLSFTFEPGIYGILGPNGAGKSTLMNILCLLKEQSSGLITYNGQDISKLNEKYLKDVGYMPQYSCLYEDFTLEEYLFYLGALKGVSKKQLQSLIGELLEKVQLSDVRRHKIKTFSGGMKQRVMLAQALLNNPQILILDEPTAGLDPKKRIEIRNLIAKLSKDKIVFIATHIVSDIEFIATKILLLKKGKLIASDTLPGLLEQMKGKVKEIELEETEVESVEQQYLVSNLHYLEDKLIARVILQEEETLGKNVYPSLEDVYLYYFGGEE